METSYQQSTTASGSLRKHRMTLLAQTFPSLVDGVPGIAPWDALALDHWAETSPAVTSGSLVAARFLLHVWNDQTDWQSGRFSLREAYAVWDAEHWTAMLAFLDTPVFP